MSFKEYVSGSCFRKSKLLEYALIFVISVSLPFHRSGKGIRTTSGTFLRPMTIDLRLLDTISTRSPKSFLAAVVESVFIFIPILYKMYKLKQIEYVDNFNVSYPQ